MTRRNARDEKLRMHDIMRQTEVLRDQQKAMAKAIGDRLKAFLLAQADPPDLEDQIIWVNPDTILPPVPEMEFTTRPLPVDLLEQGVGLSPVLDFGQVVVMRKGTAPQTMHPDGSTRPGRGPVRVDQGDGTEGGSPDDPGEVPEAPGREDGEDRDGLPE